MAPSAVADLDEIWLYVARDASIDIAERLIETIIRIFPLLAANPGMGLLRPNLGAGIRSFSVSNYRVYYRQDGGGRRRILHIRHAARDEKKLGRR